MDYQEKYLKYKTKYIELKKLHAGFSQNIVRTYQPSPPTEAGRDIARVSQPPVIDYRKAISIPTTSIFINIGVKDNISKLPINEPDKKYIELIKLLYKSTLSEISPVEIGTIMRTLSSIHRVYIVDVLNLAGAYHDENSAPSLNQNLKTIIERIKLHNDESLKIRKQNLYILCGITRTEGSRVYDPNYINLKASYNPVQGPGSGPGSGRGRGRGPVPVQVPVPDNIITIAGTASQHTIADDFSYWINAIVFTNWLSKQIENPSNINMNRALPKSTSLIIVSNDKQKMYDSSPTKTKNLFTELKDEQLTFYINNTPDQFINTFLNDIRTYIINAPKDKEPKDFESGKGFPDQEVTILSKKCVNTNIKEYSTLSELSKSIREKNKNGLNCSQFLAFMTMVKWVQSMYYECISPPQSRNRQAQSFDNTNNCAMSKTNELHVFDIANI